jgi:hypothetical protein
MSRMEKPTSSPGKAGASPEGAEDLGNVAEGRATALRLGRRVMRSSRAPEAELRSLVDSPEMVALIDPGGERVHIHASLTILARLGLALARTRALAQAA